MEDPNEQLKDLANIIEESFNEIYVFDEDDLSFIFANREARKNIGYNIFELRNLTPTDITPEFSEDQFKNKIAPLLNSSTDKLEFNTVHQRKDGSRYNVQVNLQLHHFRQQSMFVAFILDITDRVQTSKQLTFAQSLLESAPDAMVVANSKGQIVVANRQMQNLTGYTHDELLAMSVDDFVPLQQRSSHSQYRKEFHDDPKVRSMGNGVDLSALTKSGKLIPIEVSLSPVEANGEKMVTATIRDVTQRKEIEQKLRDSEERQREARQQAEKATLTKSRFLAAASHDLRQPLQALRLYLSAMKPYYQHKKMTELSDKMHLSLDTMSELLATLLDISSLESGSITADIQDINLYDLVARLEVANEPQARAKGLIFKTNIQDTTIKTDPALLERILENFISNAIRYTKQGSIEITATQIDKHVRIAVIDSGIGIPKDELDCVFEEYYQLDNDVRDRHKGLGLGLSIVKHIARILGHQLHAESTSGSGSCFSIDVPLGQAILATPIKALFPIHLLPFETTQNVLIIDNDQSIVDAMSEVLSTHNINVKQAHSGVNALKQVIQGLTPTLIISDLRMPQMDGIETIIAIREELTQDIPALIMTGDTSVELVQQSELTNLHIVNKPISEEVIHNIVELVKTGSIST